MYNTRPTPDNFKTAKTTDVCKMIRAYRNTSYHDVFLKLLFELPLEVWTENNLKPDYILKELNEKEEDKLLKMYFASAKFDQHPLIILILDKRKRAAPTKLRA